MKNYAKEYKKRGPGGFISQHIYSQKFAWLGLISIFKEEPNFRIELLAAVLALVFSIVLKISTFEFLIVIIAIAGVLMAEIVNSVVERICDLYTSEHHVGVKFIKDVAAGGVLLMSILSIIIGAVVFVPYLLQLVS